MMHLPTGIEGKLLQYPSQIVNYIVNSILLSDFECCSLCIEKWLQSPNDADVHVVCGPRVHV